MLVVVANLGHLKAYKVVETPTRGRKLELVDELNFPEAHGRFADKVTDYAGRFPMTQGPGAGQQMAPSEALTVELETQRRLVRLVARQIEAIIRREQPEFWDFAAAPEVYQAILGEITPEYRQRLLRSARADLTKTPPPELLAHFEW